MQEMFINARRDLTQRIVEHPEKFPEFNAKGKTFDEVHAQIPDYPGKQHSKNEFVEVHEKVVKKLQQLGFEVKPTEKKKIRSAFRKFIHLPE